MAEERNVEDFRATMVTPQVWHVVFTEDGIPGWIGQEPRDGSEELPAVIMMGDEEVAVTIGFLAAHRRTATGQWELRPPPPPPTPEEIAEREARLQRQAEEAAAWEAEQRRIAISEEVDRRSKDDQLARMEGRITIAEFKARMTAIRAQVESEF
jgi:hypothetical protein